MSDSVNWSKLKKHEIVLSPTDFDRLVEELNNPSPPSPALVNAAERYKQMKQQQIRNEMDEHMVKTSSAKKL